jgi:molecular chaperone DnaK (HSP70)
MKGFGIDFGTTNSLIAYFNPDIAKEPLGAFMDSDRPHPSLVWYRPDSATPVVGREARMQMNAMQNRMGNRFVRSVKRLMNDDREVSIIGTDRKPAREVGAEILKHLIHHAHSTYPAAAKEMESCVMTVPVYSTGKYRRELRRAAELAGLRVLSFAHEPFAAVFGWLYTQGIDAKAINPQKVLVFDWGGGTLDITLVQIRDGRVFELGNASLSECAGNEFTEQLGGLARDRFLQRTGLRTDQVILEGETKDRVWINVEDAKIRLSSQKDTTVNVPSYVYRGEEPLDLREVLTRGDYEQRIRVNVGAARAKVFECLERAAVEPQLVDLVLLIGGTSRTPLVSQMMHEIFVSKVALVPDADSIIAKGAALIAAHKWQPYLVKPITVKLSDSTFLPIFSHGQPLAAPLASKTLTFYCTDGRNGGAYLLFHEQQRPSDPEIQKPLNCNLVVPTNPQVHQVVDLDRIVANFYVTQDLTIRVDAESSSLGKRETIEIQDICYGLEVG